MTKQSRSAKKTLDLDPNFINPLWWQDFAGKRDFPRSVGCLTRAVSVSDEPMFRALHA